MQFKKHWLVVEGKSLHRPECSCSRRNILEHHKCLSSHFERLHGNDVQNGTELRENGVERFLQLFFLYFLVQVVDIECLVRWHLHD
jgi:hypothetical protein